MKEPYRQGTARRSLPALFALCAMLAACGGGSGGGAADPVVQPPPPPPPPPPPAQAAPAWLNVGRDAQHTGLGGSTAAQPLSRMVWRTDVDLAPAYRDTLLTTGHYGSPVITSQNTVILPVRTTAEGRYRIEARNGESGALKWQQETDFVPLNKNFSYNIAATPEGRLYYPGIGGKLYYREQADGTPGAVQTLVFYGTEAYAANKAALDANVTINTPLTIDAAGNVYFGFTVASGSPAGLAGGLVRIDAAGKASWVGVAQASGDAKVAKVANSAAPALSPDGKTVYAAVTSTAGGASSTSYLMAFDSSTLAVRGKILMVDPETRGPANIQAGATSSPLVGPDGDVYFGVLGHRDGKHTGAGWLLHYNAALTETRTPGGFGLDITPSIVPAALVGGYSGSSAYLLATKYNSYEDGQHRMAILDPNASQADRYNPAMSAMKEVITVLTPTPVKPGEAFLHEWCVNMAAVDPNTKSVFMNNSDGFLYRWDLAANKLSERFNLNSGYYQAYTPIALGPDGKVYAINNAMLTVVGK